MADAVYAVVDKSKNCSLPEKDATAANSFDSPVYDLAGRDVSTVPVPEKNEEFESVYSMVSLDNMYSTLNPNAPPRATAQVTNQRLSQPTNRIAEKTAEKERSWNEGTSCKIFACIFITIAVVALILLICIAILFVEVNKLKLTASPQQSPLGQLAPNDSNIMSELQQITSNLTEAVQNLKTDTSRLNTSIVEQLNTRPNITIINELLYQELVRVYSTLENNTQQLNNSIEMLLSQSVNNLVNLMQLSKGISSLENKTNLLNEYLGQSEVLPVTSCAAFLVIFPSSPSGYYWVRASNGSAVRVYCDMTRSCGEVTGGWTRVAKFNAAESCPSGLEHHQINTCRINSSNSATCSPVIAFDTTHEYSKVCGKINASPGGGGTNDGFIGDMRPRTLNDSYVDGVSLTHGNLGHHIWTFAAFYHIPCSCINDQDTRNPPPSFVNNDYFCDNGQGVLWDGQGCSVNSCCSFNDPPWFYKQLPQSTTDDIEMRVCRDQIRSDEDMEIQSVEIYVQ